MWFISIKNVSSSTDDSQEHHSKSSEHEALSPLEHALVSLKYRKCYIIYSWRIFLLEENVPQSYRIKLLPYEIATAVGPWDYIHIDAGPAFVMSTR